MLPSASALTLAPPTGGIGSHVLCGVGTLLFGSALHVIECSGFEFIRASLAPGSLSTTTTSADFLAG